MRQPDIEVYLKQPALDTLLEWLNERFDLVEPQPRQGQNMPLSLYLEQQRIPALIVSQANGKAWTSLWFDSPDTPWCDDASCAREINQALSIEVRCNGGFWLDGDDDAMDEWLKISPDGEESRINWRS